MIPVVQNIMSATQTGQILPINIAIVAVGIASAIITVTSLQFVSNAIAN